MMCIEQDHTCWHLFRFWNIRDVPKYRTMSFWHPRTSSLSFHHIRQLRQRGWHHLDHSKKQVRNPRRAKYWSKYLAVGGRVDAIFVVHEIRNDFESDWNWLISDESLSHFMFIQSCDIDTKNSNDAIFFNHGPWTREKCWASLYLNKFKSVRVKTLKIIFDTAGVYTNWKSIGYRHFRSYVVNTTRIHIYWK